MKRKIAIIINPASGKEEPILSYLNKALQKSHYDWEVFVTKEKYDAYRFAKHALKKRVVFVAVYGGDGTVMEVAQALCKTKIPLLLLPGGTANIHAKEIRIPPDTKEAVKLLKKKHLRWKEIDMGIVNNKPFVLRLNIGILASLVSTTKREVKEQFGQAAYFIQGLKHLVRHDNIAFTLTLNNQTSTQTGVALMIANAGNIGVTGFSVHPHVKITDGYLDVILFQTATPQSILSWARSVITKKKIQGTVRHWKTKAVTVTVSPEQRVICDDESATMRTFTAKVISSALRVIVP